MQLLHGRRYVSILAVAAFLAMADTGTIDCQITPKALSAGLGVGPAFYFGEFNSLEYENSFAPNFGYDLDLTLSYNIAEMVTLFGRVGLGTLSYDVTDFARTKYGSNFFGPIGATEYLGSSVPITDENDISFGKYIFGAQINFAPNSQWNPYAHAGLGLLTFTPQNADGTELPMTMTGNYSTNSLVFPVGGGVQYFLNEMLSFYAQGTFYLNTSDYLDGYAHYLEFETNPGVPGPGETGTPADQMMSLTLGASLVLYVPEEEEPEPPPPMAGGGPGGSAPPAQQPQQVIREGSPADTTLMVKKGTRVDTVFVDREDRTDTLFAFEPDSVAPTPVTFEPLPVDTDSDGLSDYDENNRYLTDPLNRDTDGDGLIDGQELFSYNTSPNNQDTDGDGLGDGAEVQVYGTNPLLADTDQDLLSDSQEITRYGAAPAPVNNPPAVELSRMTTDPLNPDTDGDGVIDGLDRCPRTPGPPENDGCPTSTLPSAEPLRTDGPLSGLPEMFLAEDRADFPGIYFRTNTDDFDFTRKETAEGLATLLYFMDECDDMRVLIEGHASSEGNPGWNKQLSGMRARRVRDWLVANGVPSERLLGTIGYGSALPKVPEPPVGSVDPAVLEAVRKQNRRITALVRRPCP